MTAETKTEIYQRVCKEINAVIDGEPSRIARYASVACVLSQSFETFFWTGFYLVDSQKENELIVGPYQGTLGCLRIAFDRGVCGAAASGRKTILVEDVHAYPGHIACDLRTNSEIVVPVLDANETLAAVLDIDSTTKSTFDQTDQKYLEQICATLLIGATRDY